MLKFKGKYGTYTIRDFLFITEIIEKYSNEIPAKNLLDYLIKIMQGRYETFKIMITDLNKLKKDYSDILTLKKYYIVFK